MLTKLLKYDLKSIFKPLSAFYLVILIATIVGKFSENLGDSALISIIHDFAIGSVLGFTLGAIINNVLNLWRLFHADFYKDHSYLIHTLPITTSKIYFAKFLTAIITILTTLLIATISYVITHDISYILELIQTTSYILPAIILLACLVYLEITFAIQVGFTSTVIGHRANNSRTLLSIVAGFILYAIGSILILAIVFVAGLFNSSIMQIFTDDLRVFAQADGPTILLQILTICTVAYATLIAILYLTGQRLLARGIDVD